MSLNSERLSILRGYFILFVVAIAVVVFEITLNDKFIGSDDAYIHLRYIENIRSGQGFGFNPNQPSYGDTSPLWVLVSSVVTQGANNLPQSVKSLSITLFTISVVVFYFLVFDVTSSRNLAIGSTIVYASDPWLLKWAGSAMESSLATLLILLSATFMLRSDKLYSLIITSFLLGLATLCRPEVALLFLLFVLLKLTVDKSTSSIKQGIVSLSVYLSTLSPWLLFSYWSLGTIIPNTFLAKTVASDATVFQVGWYFLRVIALSYWWAWLIILIFVVQRIIKKNPIRWRSSFTELHDKMIILFGLWCLALPAYYSISKLQTPSTRYLQLTTPLLLLASFYCISEIFKRVKTIRPHRLNLILVALVIGIGLYNVLINSLVVLPSSLDFTSRFLQTYRNIGEWLSINTDKNDQIAIAIDVGAIGYYSDRDIIDLGGLNTREVIPFLPGGKEYVFISKPEYLIITGERTQYVLLKDSRFKEIARPVYSLPLDLGIRANLDQGTGGSQHVDIYATVYELSWP